MGGKPRGILIQLIVATIISGSALYYQTSQLQLDDASPLALPPSSLEHFERLEEARTINTPRFEYIRPAGNAFELLGIFEDIKNDLQELQNSSLSSVLSRRQRRFPTSPQQIALKYGIPQTSRNVECSDTNTTQIGWIPNANFTKNGGNNDVHNNHHSIPTNATGNNFSHQGRIPRLIFQSWKTNQLRPEVCRLIKRWSDMNPQYDYFLFDDAAADAFIRLEYGNEIFSSYACVDVGAAKCDVWRLLIVYLFGGVYFDADVGLQVPFSDWDWGDRDVVTARSCNAKRKHIGGCAHQWGLIYAPFHPVLYAAIRETLSNLAARTATTVYDVSFWSYYNAWRNGPYNQSYMPGWREEMGGRVKFQDDAAKQTMVEDNGHWQKAKQIWNDVCL
mmetsp:Transcript_21798/g.46034  ORF Transcript_21798/g.46034 Transcript_21798/m.46034 type:complete len:390 (-) Transcript_21798:243-1412(-)